MKKWSFVFAALAMTLSHIMCAMIAYTYRDFLCAIEHAGFSAPATIAFFYAIPFGIAILLCVIAAILCYKRKS